MEQARAAAGGRDVQVSGGARRAAVPRARIPGRALVHIAPVLLGSGTPLFAGAAPRALEIVETIPSTHATYVHYRTHVTAGNTLTLRRNRNAEVSTIERN